MNLSRDRVCSKFFSVIVMLAGLASAEHEIRAAEKPVNFAREIQPILARRCYACHGPGTQEAGLRLDSREVALGELDSGSIGVVPGNPAQSELIQRITTDDESLRMPPKGNALSASEISLLTRWIEQGAKWESHWAFEPPARHDVPDVKQKDRVQNPIDAFIVSRLEATGLEPNPEADRRDLIRRLYFDLTGLPPTPEQVEAFARDNDPHAYEKLVDSLLASPHYGERWARHWLDVVRFAETNSFERDGDKPHAWRFRDYVIRSFNDDKPYDQFIREQIAGDEFAEPTPDSIIATGYYRLGLWDDEPADPEQLKYDGFDDLVTTTGQGFLGLTINCARCHDHKIDPITQKDYYSLLSFFHNIAPMAKEGPAIEQPIFPSDAAKANYERELAEIRQRRDRLQGRISVIEEDFRRLLSEQNHAIERPSDLEEVEYRFYRDSWQQLPDFDLIKPETIDKLPRNRFDISVATRNSDFGFVFTGVLKVPTDGEYTFILDGDDGVRLLIDGDEVIRYDGIHGEGHPRQAKVHLAQGRRDVRVDYFQAGGGRGLTLTWEGADGERHWLSENPDANCPKEGGDRKEFQQQLAQHGERLLGAERVRELKRLRENLRKTLREKPQVDYALAVTEQGKTAPETFLMVRGSPHAPGDTVEPAFPAVLGGGLASIPAVPSNTSGRRTALAEWIASPENRLTARVMVNRIWQHHFGRGIVASPNNFGLLGDAPSHPELLDWLACELMDNGWRLKPLHKLIVMSNTYRQSSAGNPLGLEKDAGNLLLWRSNMQRLSAEQLRDAILTVNGSLNPKMYGPGVYPTIPAEVLAGQSKPGDGWGKSSPEDQARRSVYIHVKRSLVTPLLAAFDFPDTDVTCEARFMTIQPGQALALLNSEFIKEQGRLFSERLGRDVGASPTERVQRGLELALSRPATPAEVDNGLKLIDRLQSEFGQSPEEALRNYCVYLYNLNEFVFLD